VLKVPGPVIECIDEGYKLPLIYEGYKLPLLPLPPMLSAKNQMSAYDNVQFLTKAIAELLVFRLLHKSHTFSAHS